MNPFRPLLLCALLLPAQLVAQPTDGQVVAGAGTITTASDLTRITQAGDRLVIDWRSFSIPAGATVDFAQPGALAAVLNRVTGSDASVLLGTLRANGQVYLLNPHGVLIGPGGRVDTAGFIASTARLDTADFLRGMPLAFTGGTDAAIVNQGTVNAVGGPVLFIARQVENRGTLSAPGGSVQLVGGTEVLLATADSPAVIRAGSAEGTVTNSPAAAIAAAQVRLQASGNNPAALAINQEGVIRATGVAAHNGEVWLVGGGDALVAQRGEITAADTDGTGGAIFATGGRLLVAEGSRTGADGTAGGGVVLLGGAERGLPSALPNAGQTLVEAGAVVSADATGTGPGGQVVAWGTDALGFYGTIFARGAAGEAGGQVETSAAWLDAFGRVETGAGGQWLLDPYNIRIVDGPSAGFAFSGTNPVVGRSTASESRVDVRALEQALGAQGRVVLDTGTVGTDVGNIILDTPLYYRSQGTARLTLNAANDIFVNHTITSLDGQLDLDFNADFDANGQGKVILGSDLITQGGSVTFQEDVVTAGSVGLSILSGGGDIIFAGNLRLDNLDGLDLSSQGGDILMSSLSSSTQRNAVLRLTDIGPRNLYGSIAALLSNPVPTPAATIGQEAGKLVKRRALRRVNNPPGFTTVAWQGFKQDPAQQPVGSQVSSGNFGPVGGGNQPFDDSYLDAPFLNQPPTGQSPAGDSYMDVAVPNTPFWASNNPPGGTAKPPFDDSYMDFPFRPQNSGMAQTPTPNGPRPPIDDSYMDAPFANRPPTAKPPIDDSYMDFPPKPGTGGTSGPANQVNPIIVQTNSGPVISTVTTADANGPQVAPGQTFTTVSVVVPTSGSTTSTATTAQPPIVVTGGPTQVSSISSSSGPLVVTQEHPTIQVGGPTTGSPTIVTQVVAQPQPVTQPGDQRPVVAQAVPQVPAVSGPQINAPALQAPNTPTVVATNPTIVAVPSLPAVVNNPPANVPQPPAQQPGPVFVQAVPQVPTVSGPQNNLPALQVPNTPTVINQPVAVAVPSLPVVVNNPVVVPQPPAQQPGPVIVQAVPQVPTNSGPQNNLPALQGPNTPTVVATNPAVVAVPTLPVVVNNPPVVPQPPAQQPGPINVQAVPQVPAVSGPQNNLPALQASNTPTVINQPVAVAVPSLPVVVNNPVVVPQPPAQQPGPVIVQAMPQVPTVSGPQNNLPALQAPSIPTVVATNPTVVAVPTLAVVVNNPPVNVPQPPPAQQPPEIAQLQPPLPVVSGPQNNAPALQAPNTPVIVATNSTVVAVPSLPVVVDNPPAIPQPPAQPPGPVIVQAVPQVPTNSGPQNNLPALQAPNTPTVINQPVAVAVPSLPVVVSNPAVVLQPPAQQPGPVIVQAVPQVPTVSGPQNNLPALQVPNTPTVHNQPAVVAVPPLPVVVNNPPANVPQPPPAQQPPVVAQLQPPLPTVSGPQNNLPALQAPNTPTVVATNPTVIAVPTLPVVVNNSPAIPQPPAQPPGLVIVQAVPQIPTNSGPQNNLPALQAPNTSTVVNQPVVMAVPSLPVIVNNPPVIPQPPAQPPGPVSVQAVPQIPTVSGPQNNLPALQAPNASTVVATNPTVVAVPSLPAVLNNPPANVPQPPAQQPGPVIVQAVPQVPVISGPQNNLPALQAPNTPTVVATNPAVVAVPSLPVVVNNPPANVPQPPPAQQPQVVAQLQPPLPVVSGPQDNAPALQAPNTPTVVATQSVVVAVPSIPVVVTNPPDTPQPPAQQPGVVVAQAVPQLPVVSGPQNNAPALQGPITPTVTNQPVVAAVPSLPNTVTPPPTGPDPQPVVVTALSVPPLSLKEPTHPGAVQGPVTTSVITQVTTVVGPPQEPVTVPGDGGLTGPVDPGHSGSGHGPELPGGGGTTEILPQQPGVTGSVVDTGSNQPDGKSSGSGLARVDPPRARKEAELMGLHYSVIYRNYETQTLVDDIGRPLYALTSGYELFLFLEGRRPRPVAAAPLKAAPPSR